MRQRVTALVLIAVLVFYVFLVGSRGMIAIRDGRPVTVVLGLAILLVPVVGAWYIWREVRFGFAMQRLARELAAEGGLPADELARTPGGGSIGTAPTRCSSGARPRWRPRPTTGGAGIGWPWPTATRATTRAGAGRC